MGNCNKNNEKLSFTNFDDSVWSICKSKINAQCFILVNNHNKNIRLYKWVAQKGKLSMATPHQASHQYTPNIYQQGQYEQCSSSKNREFSHSTKRYLITQQLVRINDLFLSEYQIVLVALKSLLAFKKIINEKGRFVPKSTMIYMNREGIIKVWVNQNLAAEQFQYPHPAIRQEQFINSLIHQIFTGGKNTYEFSRIYQYIKQGIISFDEVSAKLSYYLKQKIVASQIQISKQAFEATVQSYIQKRKNQKTKNQKSLTIQKDQKQLSSSNRIKFLVADNSFVKDYSFKQMKKSNSLHLYEK